MTRRATTPAPAVSEVCSLKSEVSLPLWRNSAALWPNGQRHVGTDRLGPGPPLAPAVSPRRPRTVHRRRLGAGTGASADAASPPAGGAEAVPWHRDRTGDAVYVSELLDPHRVRSACLPLHPAPDRPLA